MDKHDTLLLVCSSTEDRAHLGNILRDNYNLLEACNSQQMMLLLRQNKDCIAAVVSDMEIWEILTAENPEQTCDADFMAQIPVIIISENDSSQILSQGFDYGAVDVIPLYYDDNAMVRRIETVVQLHLHRQHLQVLLKEQGDALKHSNEMMVDALSSIIEYRSAESGQHILRIRHFSKILLEEVQRSCPEYQLTDEIVSIISSASALHDVGKIAIPDSILTKPGKLTAEEWEVMKTHCVMGCRILDSLAAVGNQEYLRYAYNICRHHHERWDGSGYPDGLAGDRIPICAQVVGLADAYDALTSKRVYKDAYSFETAMNMILRGECGTFSPKILECFKHVAPWYEALARAYADGLAPKTEQFDVTLPEPVVQEGMDTLNVVQGKYLCLLHYINGFVLELSVDRGHYHLRYNPYPELAAISEAGSFQEMIRVVLEEIVSPSDRQRMRDLIYEGIENYLDSGLRHQSFRFLLMGNSGQPEPYDVTLLRANVNQKENRTLAVLCRKTGQVQTPPKPSSAESFATNLIESTFCCRNDRNFTLVQMGSGITSLAGYSAADMAGMFDNGLLHIVHPEDRKMLRRSVQDQLLTGNSFSVSYRVVCKDGSIRWILSRSRLVLGEDGLEYIYSLALDNSEAHSAYAAINDKIRRYEIILAQTENVLFEWDIKTDTISFSDTWEQLFGFAPIESDVMHHLSQAAFFHPDDVELLASHISTLKKGSNYEMAEARISTARGRYLWCRFRATAIRDENGDLEKICGIIINIDAEKQSSQALQERAERDSLTKLLNKYAYRKQAEEYFDRNPQGVNCAMLMIDLDNFKAVNDRYGHLFGDTVLTQASRVLKRMFRSQDIIARVGGDEFMVLLRGTSDAELLKSRCRQLITSFSSTFRRLNQDIPLSCSVGVAVSPDHGENYYELYRHADQALYQAKAMGKNTFAFYNPKDIPTYAPGRKMTDIDSDQEPGLAKNSLVQYSFQRLYTSENEDAAVNEILDLVGRQMNVSRVYIFENSDDNRFCSNTYEWCNEGILPEIMNLQGISYEDDIAGYTDMYDEDGIFYCPDINTLPENIYNIVAPQGIKSLLHCAIRDRGVFRGYIGFDECVTQRMWTREQIEALVYLSEMLSVFLLKKRQQEKALRQAEDFRSILDNQNAWIYIIDPHSCELKYLNAKVRQLAPDARPGMYCYEALMGRGSRCAGCPSVNILNKITDQAPFHNEKFNLDVLADATLVRWEGVSSCMLTCREFHGRDKKEEESR